MKLNQKLQLIDSISLVHYILAKLDKANHLKIQKLAYYIQAYHLAYFDQSIIEDDFEAWIHGPVSKKIWNYLKRIAPIYEDMTLNATSIKKPSIITKISNILLPEQLSFINDVIIEFGKRNSYELECLTHSEMPWIQTRNGFAIEDKCNKIISKNIIKKFYKQKLYGT